MAEEISIVIRAKDEASRVMKAMLPTLKGIDSDGKAAAAGMGKLGADISKASDQAKAAGGAFSSMGRAASGAVGALGQIGLAGLGLQTLAAGAKGLGDALGFGLNAELENTKAQLVAFTKDGAQAEKILADIKKEASLTPFAFGEMAKATAGLMPVAKQSGIALMDLVKQAEILAASNPAQGLEGAAVALKEAVGGDFVSVIERFNLPRGMLNQLKADGVPALQAVGMAMKSMGFDADLVTGLAATATGRWSTFMDTMDGLRASFSKPMFELFSAGLGGLQTLLDDNAESLTGAAEAAGAFAGKLLTDGVAAVKGFLPSLRLAKDAVVAMASGKGFDVLYEGLVTTFGADIAGKIAKVIDPLARFRADILPGIVETAGALKGKLVDGIDAVVAKGAGLVQFFRDNQLAADAATAAVGAYTTVALGRLAMTLPAVTIALYAQATAAGAAGVAMAIAAVPFVAFGAVAAAVILAGITIARNWELITFVAETMRRVAGKAFADLGTAIGSGFATASANVGKFFSDLGTAVNGGLTAAASAVGGFFSRLGSTVNAGLTAAWAYITERFGAIPGIFQAGWDAVTAVGTAFWSGLTGIVQGGIDAITAPIRGFQMILDGFGRNWASTLGFLTGRLTKFAGDTLRGIVDWGVQTHDALVKWAEESISAAASFAAGAVGAIGNFASAALVTVQGWVSNAAAAIAGFASAAPGAILGFASATLATIGGWAASAGTALQGWASNAAAAVGRFVTEAPTAIAGFASAALSTIGTWISDAGTALQGWASDALATVGRFVTEAPEALRRFATAAMTVVGTFVADTVRAFGQLVTDSIARLSGLIDQVPQVFGAVLDYLLTLPGQWRNAAVNAAASFWEGFKQGLGIHSPSFVERAFMAIGEQAITTAQTVKDAAWSMQQSLTTITGVGNKGGLGPSAGLVLEAGGAVPAGNKGGIGPGAGLIIKTQAENAAKVAEIIMRQIAAGAKGDLQAALDEVAKGNWIAKIKFGLQEAIRTGGDTKPFIEALTAIEADKQAWAERKKVAEDFAKVTKDMARNDAEESKRERLAIFRTVLEAENIAQAAAYKAREVMAQQHASMVAMTLAGAAANGGNVAAVNQALAAGPRPGTQAWIEAENNRQARYGYGVGQPGSISGAESRANQGLSGGFLGQPLSVTLNVDGRELGAATSGGAYRDGINLARSGAITSEG